MAKTPREAKQEFLNDLIAEYRSTTFTGYDDETAAAAKKYNRALLERIAKKHGLVIPPK